MALTDKMIIFAKDTCNDALMDMAAIRKLSIGIQNFESLKKDGCIRFALLTGVTKFGKALVG